MTMSAVIDGHGDGHLAGDFLVMFTVAGDAIHGVDVFEKNGVLWVFKFSHGVRVREFFQGITVAVHAGRVRNAGGGEDVLFFLVSMAGGALHFDLVVAVSGASREERSFVFSFEEEVIAVASDGSG